MDRLGVDILQNCEVTGMVMEQGRVCGVTTTRGTIRANQVAMVVAGHTDTVGPKEMNVALSRQRAESVIAWLGAHGIEGRQAMGRVPGGDERIGSGVVVHVTCPP